MSSFVATFFPLFDGSFALGTEMEVLPKHRQRDGEIPTELVAILSSYPAKLRAFPISPRTRFRKIYAPLQQLVTKDPTHATPI